MSIIKKCLLGSFPLSRQGLAALLILAGAASTAHADTHPPIAPLSPAELLPLLPPTPKGWKLTESNARNFCTTWVLTIAKREFKYTPPLPPGADPNAPPNQPQTTLITLMDSGYYPGSTAAFKDFKPGTKNGSEKLMMQDFPAIENEKTDTNPERLTVLIQNRFIAIVVATNQEPKATEKWFSQLNLAALTSIPDSAAKPLHPPIIMSVVDELDASKDHSYLLRLNFGG